MGRRHALPDVVLTGDYKVDVERFREFLRNVKDGFSGDPAPHALTHRVGQTDPLPTPGSPRTVLAGGSASIGSGPSYMREDAQLIVGTGAPVDLGAANTEGAATTVARSNHVHKRSVEVRVNSVLVAVRRMINLIAGTGVTIGGVDDGAGDEVEVTISASAFPPTVLRPAQITADQNNYNPGPYGNPFVVLFLSSNADRSITGLVAAAVDGTTILIWNVGAFVLTLPHQNAGSSAANRFACQGSADVTINPGFSATLTYDLTATRWRAREE